MTIEQQHRRPVIYQLLPRLFGNRSTANIPGGTNEQNGCGKFNDISSYALESIKELGNTHLWYTGIIEHAHLTDYSKYGIAKDHPDVVKGRAGSPYAIKDYYDVDPDLANSVPDRMQEFEALVKRTHDAGLKVIIDLVPNHVARHYVSDAKPDGVTDFGEDDDVSKAFHRDNNFYYLPGTKFQSPIVVPGSESWNEEPAKATGNDCFKPNPSVNDWYETVKLNYGVDFLKGENHFSPVPDTWKKMLDVVLFWASKKVDGFRCDMAALVPVEFWTWMIDEVKRQYPSLQFIAEIYDSERYHEFIFKAGFDFLYDKELFYNTMRGVIKGHRPAIELTSCWQCTDGFQHHMVYFLENHDEQRIASSFFADNPQKALPGVVVMATMQRNPLLIYSGQELGEKGMDKEGFSGMDGRTSIFDYWSPERIQQWAGDGDFKVDNLPDEVRQLRQNYSVILNLSHKAPALMKGLFYDLSWSNVRNEAFNSSSVYAYFRYCSEQILLVIANFSGKDLDYRLHVPPHFFDLAGLSERFYFTGHDLLKNNKMLQFPAEVALNAGLGGHLKKHSASVYELKYEMMKRG
ncbi:alpha-amylase family glycosyl hydrolase [Marinilabilia salmonicolor]|uniref:alpha-amylase family glycosyl hydrolase n=1 Tax=Marinilabilia salmonicolor TaxID=989 RepID=UPI00056658BD|nr:alpha-amylase family glycosyl hydrolase [Marinilabilia salmonicolor]